MIPTAAAIFARYLAKDATDDNGKAYVMQHYGPCDQALAETIAGDYRLNLEGMDREEKLWELYDEIHDAIIMWEQEDV